MKEKLGFEPSDKQLASSLRMSYSELRSKLIECSLARRKLAMSNIRLVMSIAQKYDNLGAEMADLIQVLLGSAGAWEKPWLPLCRYASNTARSAGVKPETAMAIPKRCNLAYRPAGYKCGDKLDRGSNVGQRATN
ncbi:uncharacterized protein A4U43_C03F31480 [Asparagus officinalis]|uniref:Uncharacterized protein n=1 Tax=Asparagus officinalis TaxID=4686 RepID=A0A5P1FEE6_ASPOF|nr:uncharacterized protein A4U43_C03F31480 [Asparagus officinalis]